jgi:hypothetical protein
MDKANLNGAIKKRSLTVTEGVVDVITLTSNHIAAGGKDYYFIPYWWQATDDPNVFIAHHLDGELPEDLVTALEALSE